MDPGTAFAVLQVSGSMIKIINKYYKDIRGAESEVNRLLRDLEDFQTIMQKIQEMLQDKSIMSHIPASAPLATAVARTLSDLTALEIAISPSTQRKILGIKQHTLKWPLKRGEVIERLALLEKHKATLILALDVDQLYVLQHPLILYLSNAVIL